MTYSIVNCLWQIEQVLRKVYFKCTTKVQVIEFLVGKKVSQ